MARIKLYKNDELVLEKDGDIVDNRYQFDNISYDHLNNILIREDDEFKYELDFNNNEATIQIKSQNYTLNLDIETTKIEKYDDKHKVYYTIESEEKINNILEIYFN